MGDQYLSQVQTQRQSQILAPQLRQSLELLQVATLELRTLIRQELEQNPTVEETPMEMEQIEVEPEKPEKTEEEEAFDKEFDKLAKLDDEWRDYFSQTTSGQGYSKESAEKRQFLFDSLTQAESLQQHLMNQLTVGVKNDTERQIGELIIGSINDEGFMTSTVEELAETTGFTLDQLRDMLTVVQDFDPIGVGARDLKECLLIQLRRLGKGESTASILVRDHLDALGGRKFPEIARAMKVSVEHIHEAARLIATLEPKPGRAFISDEPAYVLPEVSIVKNGDDYVILMNNEQIPHLHISDHYRQLMADESTKSDVKSYIREKVRAGMFLIKSIGQRQQTIYNIAREIVRIQREFLDKGITHLRPLTMAEVANVLGIHETTVSRALANKYVSTPRGTFEMKYFFTPGYKNADGQSVSNKTIKDVIAQLVENEDPSAPLSDDAMAKRVKEQGITVARRTIAKYRDELRILPSHLRKGYAK
jgi:RNA polymerase sigma-54 factor